MSKIMKSAKIWFILAIVVVVAGAFMMGFLGMNETVSYGGGYELTVKTDAELETYDKVVSVTEKVFADNGLHYEYRKELDEKATLIYGFDSEVSASVVDAVNAALKADTVLAGYNPEAELNETLVLKDASRVWMAILVVAIVAVCAFFYGWIRYKLASGVALLILLVINTLITVTLSAICRVPVGEYYLAAIGATILLGLMMNVFWMFAAKDLKKNVANEDKSPAEIAVMAGNATAKLNLGLLIAVIVAAVLLIALGSMPVKYVGITMAVGMISSEFVAICLTGTVWTMLKNVGVARAKKAAYQGKEKETVAE